MAHFQSIDDSAYETVDGQSLYGHPVQIAQPKSDVAENTTDAKVMGKESFGCQVNWPVTNDDNWRETTSEVKKVTGISHYCVHKQDGPVYTYKLWIKNEENYNYTFYDQTGDGYGIDCWRNGTHSNGYNSSKPTMLFVTGK